MENERKFTYEDVRRITHELILLVGVEVDNLAENELEREYLWKEYGNIALFAMNLTNNKIDALLTQYNVRYDTIGKED